MKLVVGNYQHVIDDADTAKHITHDGEWCWCAPVVRDLPLVVADREGYLKVVIHPSADARAARAQRLA